MPKPYSYDLRQKVMQAIEMDGLKKNEASELFGISRNTINLWFIAVFKKVRTKLNENGHSIAMRKPAQKILLGDSIKYISNSLI